MVNAGILAPDIRPGDRVVLTHGADPRPFTVVKVTAGGKIIVDRRGHKRLCVSRFGIRNHQPARRGLKEQ